MGAVLEQARFLRLSCCYLICTRLTNTRLICTKLIYTIIRTRISLTSFRSPETFNQMVAVMQQAKQQLKPGRPSKLSLENQVLMTLE